jgi:poly(hydroxyalkanoate) depolymerase family esterase
MHRQQLATMMEATRLTREGRLDEATALLQGASRQPAAREPFVQWQVPPIPPRASRAKPAAASGGVGGVNLQDLLSHLPGSGRVYTGRGASVGAAAPELPGRWLRESYANRAGERDYRLYVPSGYTGQPAPLITMLHGGTQGADDFAAGTCMNELAERHTFLVAYPEQSTHANPMRYWNWFQPAHQHRDSGEPSLIAGITRHVAAEHVIDPARVYVAGFSAGAAMAAVMAACYPDVYAAVGVHSGLAYGVASDVASAFDAMKNGARRRSTAGTVPLMVFHGDADPTVDHVNAQCLVDVWLRAAGAPSSRYRSHSVSGRVPHGRRYTRNVFTDGDGAPVIEQWSIHEGGHAWSGGSPRGSYTDPLGPSASAELLRFFLHHTVAASHGRPRRRSSALPSAEV